MSGWIQREDRLFDPVTGALAGYVDLNGKEQLSGFVNPTANDTSKASANAAAIQAVLTAGLVATLPPNLGPVYINRTLQVRRGLVCGPGTYLTRIPGVSSYHLVRNWSCHGVAYVNGQTITGGQITVNEPGHPYSAGDVIYCENWQGNATLNGPQTITAAVEGVSFTFAASGGNPTNTATQCMFHSRYNPLSGANFVRASNVVTVTEPGHQRGIGDRVWIAGLGGTNTFNGVAEVTAVTPGVSWTYANTGTNEAATGTAQLLGDRMIDVRLSLDGNTPNLSGTKQGTAHLSMWGNVSHLIERIDDARNGQTGRASNHYNVTDHHVPYAASSNSGAAGNSVAVLCQWDSYCDRVTVGEAFGVGQTDDQIAWGVTSNAGPFADTAQPTGPGNMGSLTVGTINGGSTTGILKMYATTGYDAGRVTVRRVAGQGPIAIGDPSTGVSGGTYTSLTIDEVDNTPLGTNGQLLLGSAAWSSMGDIKIGKLRDNEPTASSTRVLCTVQAPYKSLRIDQIFSRVQRTDATGGLLMTNQALPIDIGVLDANLGSGGRAVVAYGTAAGASLSIGVLRHVGAANGNGEMVVGETGGYWSRVNLGTVNIASCSRLIYANTTTAAQQDVTIGGGNIDQAASVFADNKAIAMNIFATNLRLPTDANLTNRVLQFFVTGTVARFVGRNIVSPASKLLLTGNSVSISIDCKEAKVDMGASAGSPPAVLVPQAGDQLTNTNATGGGVYIRNNGNNGWVLQA